MGKMGLPARISNKPVVYTHLNRATQVASIYEPHVLRGAPKRIFALTVEKIFDIAPLSTANDCNSLAPSDQCFYKFNGAMIASKGDVWIKGRQQDPHSACCTSNLYRRNRSEPFSQVTDFL